jgi:hypothetical protein
MKLSHDHREAPAPTRTPRRLITVTTAALLLGALALLMLAAGPAEAASPSAPLSTADRYGQPAGQTDNVVIYDRDLYYEIHIAIDGTATPFQIGQQYAEAMLQAQPYWMTYVYIYLSAAPWVVDVSYKDMLARSTAIKQSLSSEVRGYIEGMASVVTKRSGGLVNENDCYVLNLYPDVARATMCSALGAWGSRTAGGRPLVGRNLDWSDDVILPKLNAVTVYHNGAKSFCSLGYIGLWEVISGFNDNGLYGAILDAETGKPYPDPTNHHSYPMDLRTALQTTRTITDAAEVLQTAPYCFDHQILLADKTRVGVLENDLLSNGPLARKVRDDATPLNPGITWGYKDAVCAVNSFVSKGNDSARFKPAWNTERWKAYTAQMKMVGKTITVDKMKTMLAYGNPDSHTAPYNTLTTQMMVYQPATGHLDIFMKPRSGGLPKNPQWKSLDIDFGNAMFAGRWTRTWQPEGWEVTDSRVATAPGGDVCAALQLSRNGGADRAIGLARYRADGRRRWTRIIDPAGTADAELAGLAVASGTVVVGGTRADEAGSGWLLARYTAKGRRAWLKTIDGMPGHIDRLGDLVCDGKGNVYAGGGETVADGAATTQDWCLRKLAPTGAVRWERFMASDPGLDETITGVSRMHGSVVITGTWGGDGTTGQLAAARFGDAGARRWFTPWTHPDVSAPEPTGVSARPSGVAVSGHDRSPLGGQGRVALRLDASSGVVEWAFADPPDKAGESSAFHDVAIDRSGRVVAVGQTLGVVTPDELGVLSWFDDDGAENAADFGGSSGANAINAVACGDDSTAYATGTATAAEGEPQLMTTTSWSAAPQQLWSITFGGSSAADPPCTGHDLTLRGVRLFVTGSSGAAFVIARYDTSVAAASPAY